MLRHVGQAQRLGVSNQLPEHPGATRQRTDEPPRVLVDPQEDEALELLLALVENAERGIARACELAGGLEHMAQHGLHVEVGNERASDVEELAQLLFVQLTLRLTRLRVRVQFHWADRSLRLPRTAAKAAKGVRIHPDGARSRPVQDVPNSTKGPNPCTARSWSDTTAVRPAATRSHSRLHCARPMGS